MGSKIVLIFSLFQCSFGLVREDTLEYHPLEAGINYVSVGPVYMKLPMFVPKSHSSIEPIYLSNRQNWPLGWKTETVIHRSFSLGYSLKTLTINFGFLRINTWRTK